MFGSLNIRGGYVAHDMAAKVSHFWELQKNPDPAWILGAKEEQASIEAYENMVRFMRGTPTEEADNHSAYIEHRLRLATSNDGGKTFGPLLNEVLSDKFINPEMRTAAVSPPLNFSLVRMTQTGIKELKFQAAQALHPVRYFKLDSNGGMEVEYSRNEAWKNPDKVAVRSLDGRSLPLLTKQSLGKRKRLSGDEDDDEMNMEDKGNDGSLNTVTAGSSGVYAKPLQDWKSQFQSIFNQNIETRAIRVGKHSAKKSPPFQKKKKKLYSWMKSERDENDIEASEQGNAKMSVPFGTRISARTSGLENTTFGTRTSGLCTSRRCTFDIGKSNTRIPEICTLENHPEFELSDFTAPLTLISKPKKRRKNDKSRG